MPSTKVAFSTLALIVAIAMAALSGCSGSSTSKPLTRAELTAKANAICRRVIAQVDWSKVTPADLPRTVDRLAALEEQAGHELEKLTPPTSIADEWQLIVDGFKLTGPEFKQIARSAGRVGPGYAIPLSNAQHERALGANEIGITECAKY
jgi:hypothetical protein